MAISRLFFEIGGDAKALNESLKEAIANAKQTGVEVTRAGRAIISRFDEALNPTKNLTEQIHLLEKAGKSSADIQKVLGDQIYEATKKAKAMGQPIDDLIKKYITLDRRLRDVGDQMQRFGAGATKYLTAPIVAMGAAALKSADDFDKGIAKIRISTGATGDRLKALTADLTQTWGTIPQGAEQIGQAIADINTRLGLTGRPLQEMATQVLNLSRITGSDLTQTIAATTRLFGDWSIATENQAETLDYMFRVSQTTGIQMQKLLEVTVQYGAPMRALGFNLEQAAVAMGKWEKEGVNMETVLSGLRYGLGQFAKAGVDPVEALANIQAAIKGAKTEAEATSISLKAFGQRAAVDLGKAIQEGRFDLIEYIKTARESKDTINAAAAEAKTFGERMQELQQRTEKALVPVGEKLIEAFEDLQPTIISAIETVADITKAFADLEPWEQKTIIGFTGLLAAIGPASYAFGTLAKGTAAMLPHLQTMVTRLGGTQAVLGGVGKAAGVAGAAFAGWEIGRWIAELFDLDNKLGDVWTKLGLFQGRVKEADAALEKAAGRTYAALVKNYGEEIQKMGLDIERGSKSLVEWNDALNQAGIKLRQAIVGTQEHTQKVKENTDAVNTAGGSLGALDEELTRLQESLYKAARPADALATEMKRLHDANAPLDEIMAAYGVRLVEAVEQQEKMGLAVSGTVKQFYQQALVLKTQLDFFKAEQEALKLIEESQKKMSEDAAKRIEKAKADAEAAADITKKVEDIAIKGKREEMELQKRLLELTIPRTEAERVRIEQEKNALEFAIKADEIRVKFAQQRAAIVEAINKMDFSSEAYKEAVAALDMLNVEEKKALERLRETNTAEVIAQQNQQVQSMYDKLKEGAGDLFDAIVSRGKGSFTSLSDWIEGVFLSNMKTVFQNFMAGMQSGQGFNLGSIFSGTAIGGLFGGQQTPQAGSWGNLGAGEGGEGGGGMTGGLGNLGSMDWSKFFASGQEGGFYNPQGMFGEGGGGPGNMMGAMGGATLFMQGIREKGAAGWGKTIGGGALTGLSIGGPIGAGIGALAGLGVRLGMLARGKNAWEAGQMEVTRDYGGVNADQAMYQQYLENFGWQEEKLYPLRKNVSSSPRFLAEFVYPLAQEQGKVDEFLKSLEKVETSWGNFNFRDAFEQGLVLDDWDELNKLWTETSKLGTTNNEEIQKLFDSMRMGDDAVSSLVESFKGMRQALMDSLDTTSDMVDQFMNAGVITQELRDTVDRLGGDITKFEALVDASGIQEYFDQLAETFRQTHVIMPDLVRLIEQYGGTLQGIDTSRLDALTENLGTIGNLSSGLASLQQRFDPINKLLQGEFDASVQAALSAAGLDAERFANVAGLINTQNNWSSITQGALSGGAVSPELLDMLSRYGGESGALAVARYNEGFNTITADLLESTKAAMDTALNAELTSAMDYLAEVGQQTNNEINELTDMVEQQLQVVGDNISQAVMDATEEIVEVLGDLALAAYRNDGTEPTINETAQPAGTFAANAGSPLEQAAAAAGISINIESVYGNSDLQNVILEALQSLVERGALQVPV